MSAAIVDSAGLPANAAGVLGADGAVTEWLPWAELDGRLGPVVITAATATRGDWQLRMLRIDSTAGGSANDAVHGVRLTGHAVPATDGAQPAITDVHQGVDVRVDADGTPVHTEVRMLVPWDGELAVAGGPSPLPSATVLDPPTGFPMIIAVRLGAEDPAVPQIEEKSADSGKKPIRILRTGLSIPEVELAPAPDGGHAITVLWPDRTREVVLLPARA
ncbi:hypothetical protein GCM10022240_19520 [Microbacterium kribbense]|uniref:Secreted protein n=1 Tax=Microbacterium kribbense TaxID=433645 RepID=A0ABP7GL20_9MICO